jgi:hypothetical protein
MSVEKEESFPPARPFSRILHRTPGSGKLALSVNKKNIFVVGGSAGALGVVKELVRDLPPDFPGTLFAVTHAAADFPGTWPAYSLGISRGGAIVVCSSNFPPH